MVYPFIKVLVRISTSVFFKRIVVSGQENLPEQGPLIIVANHPNTLMDPMLIAALAKQRIGFVANAGLFSNRLFAAFFRLFQVIPIYRKKDVMPGEKPNNAQAFAKCHEYLGERGTFLIFPEGSSYYEINLREIKTGTARIALSYEGAAGALRIIPIALDYSDAIQFRSAVRVTIGAPMEVSAYTEAYQRDEVEAVDLLTADIRKALAEHVPWTTGKDQEDLLIKAHTFYTTYAEPAADLHEDPERSLELRKQLADALHHLRLTRPDLYQDTSIRLLAFFDGLRADHVTPGFFTEAFHRKNKALVCAGYLLQFLLLLPLYLFGLATNYLPYILPSLVFKTLNLELEYKAPVQMIVGLITFPLFYGLEVWAFRYNVDTRIWTTLLFLLSLPISGYVTLWYWTDLQRFARVLRFLFHVSKDRKQAMWQERDAILACMEDARKSL
jgi:glycerol-3-phosphate O-acyltransferase / dihydroxyacetone phosphate acyltransferase